MTIDPLQTVHHALEAEGCQPQGAEWKFTAKCPAHEDRSPSLSVAQGADGRALLHCHAGCPVDAIVLALGLRMGDLFPLGHRSARPPRPVIRRAQKPAEALLVALDRVGAKWSGLVSTACPYCQHPAVWWRIDASGVSVDCPEGCTREEVLRALETLLELDEARPERVA